MLSQHHLRGKLGGCRLGSGQAAGVVVQSAVVSRRVVSEAMRLPAKAEAEDQESILVLQSGLRLKRARTVNAVGRRGRVSAPSKPATDGDISFGSNVAALRDGTATASTSGHNHHHSRAHAPSHSQHKHQTLPDTASTSNALSLGSDAASVSTPPETASESAPEPAPELTPEPAPKQGKQVHPLPPGVTAERDKDIYNELRGCEDWRDVLDVVADESTQLSVRTAVQALTRLNALTRGSAAAQKELVQLPDFQMLTQILNSQVSIMNNVQLANSLYAFARLQVQLPEDVLAAYFAASAQRESTFFPRDIATLLAAAAAMRWSPPQDLLDTMCFRATGFLSAKEFDSRSIPTLLHSCALLGYTNQILALAAAQQLAVPGVVASLAPQGVANSIWALGRMGTYHPPAVEAALSAFAAVPLSYKPQEVANLLWALTAFRHHPEGRFAVIARSLLHRQDELRPADVATLLYALAFFNVAPGKDVLGRVAARADALLSAADTSNDPGAAGRSFGSANANAVELCNMYWGLALLGEVEIPLFARLEAAVAAAWERAGGALPDNLLRLVFQGFLASRLASSRRPTSFPPLALDAFKRSWTGTVMEVTAKETGRRTLEDVATILSSIRVKHDKRRPTGDGLAVIDLALKAGPERYVALQVVDDLHQCANSKQLLGQVILQGQLLEKNGWEVRYLGSRDLERLAPDMQTQFVAELLRGMGIRVRTVQPPAPAAAAGAAGAEEPVSKSSGPKKLKARR